MQILRLPTVKAAFGHKADATVYNQVRDGLLTQGVHVGQRSKGWPSTEIYAILNARIAGKSDTEIRELVKQLHAQRASAGLSSPLLAPPAPAVTPPDRNGRLQLAGV